MIESINFMIVDIDGVMTNGEIILSANGDEFKLFNAQDGAGIKYWMRAGHRFGIITGRYSQCVTRRAQELGIPDEYVFQGAKKKMEAFVQLKHIAGISGEECAYIGDDLPDLPVMKQVAYPVAVANAVEEVQAVSLWKTTREGGKGAVRETIEHILHQQGRWSKILADY